MPTEAAPVVWINGWPGVGKLTIAQTLCLTMGPQRAVLFDYSSLEHTDLMEHNKTFLLTSQNERERSFKECVEDVKHIEKILIFVDFKTESQESSRTVEEYRNVAQRIGRPFIPVSLTCEVTENVKRVGSMERRSSLRGVNWDGTTVQQMRRSSNLFRFPDLKSFDIDVSDLEAHQAASKIREHLLGRQWESVVDDPAKSIASLSTKQVDETFKFPKTSISVSSVTPIPILAVRDKPYTTLSVVSL